MNIHKFDSTGDAYDACQCDDDIKNGDTLVIESEKVVGIAWTWPVAVTKTYGKLHRPIPGGGTLTDIFNDAFEGVEEAIEAALAEANRLKYEVVK